MSEERVIAIGIVAGTPLGAALAKRLREDGREVHLGGDDAALRAMAKAARLVLVDAGAAEVSAVAERLGAVLDGNHLVAHMVRGLPSGRRAVQIFHDVTAVRRIGVIGGPLRAGDLEAGTPSAAVVASTHPEVVDEFARAMSTPKLRVYRGRDPLGVELAGAVEQIVAVGCGVVDALQLGATTRTVLLVRAVRELSRLTVALGGEAGTASGLAGLGDFMAVAADTTSDGYLLGRALVDQPKDAHPARASITEVAQALRKIGGGRVQTHLFAGLGQLLEGGLGARDILARLMELPVLDD